MSQSDDRIKLAEAMGWVWTKPGGGRYPIWCRPDGSEESPNTLGYKKIPPASFRPDTNANDDYAVLEWMRKRVISESASEKDHEDWEWFVTYLHSVTDHDKIPDYYSEATGYIVGDYARAALKVLDD